MNTINIIRLPGLPIVCTFCGKPVRWVRQTAAGRWCPCGAKLEVSR